MSLTQPQCAAAEGFAAAAQALGLYAPVRIGPVGDGNSVSVLLTPDSRRTVYLDGTVRQRVSLLIVCAHHDRLLAAQVCSLIFNKASGFTFEIPDGVLERILPLSPPQETGVEPDGRVLFTATVAVDFTSKG